MTCRRRIQQRRRQGLWWLLYPVEVLKNHLRLIHGSIMLDHIRSDLNTWVYTVGAIQHATNQSLTQLDLDSNHHQMVIFQTSKPNSNWQIWRWLTSWGYWLGSCRWDLSCTPCCGRPVPGHSPTDDVSSSSALFNTNLLPDSCMVMITTVIPW